MAVLQCAQNEEASNPSCFGITYALRSKRPSVNLYIVNTVETRKSVEKS